MRKRDKVAATVYVDGYRRAPESAAEIRMATVAALTAFSSEPWDAEGEVALGTD